MAIPEFSVDMDIISKLGDYPGPDNNLTPDGFRKKFDQAGKYVQEYINTILLPYLNQLVDVEELLKGILDPTLTSPDKAAPAKTVGNLAQNISNDIQIKQASAFEKTVQSGDYVIGSEQSFAANTINANQIRVMGGEAVIQGHLVSLNVGSYTNVDIKSGVYGTYRNDLICARYERNADGFENNRIVLIEGTPNQTVGIDPAYRSDDINKNVAVLHDMPLYRIKVINTDIAVEKLFSVQKSFAKTLSEMKNTTVNVTLTASGWTGSRPYTQSVQVDGLDDDKQAKAYPNWPENATSEAALRKETAKISSCRRTGSTMTFRCLEDKPTMDISITVEVSV